MCVSISATVALGCLFAPKVYIVLFQPHKNVRQHGVASALNPTANRMRAMFGMGRQMNGNITSPSEYDQFYIVKVRKAAYQVIGSNRPPLRHSLSINICLIHKSFQCILKRLLHIVYKPGYFMTPVKLLNKLSEMSSICRLTVNTKTMAGKSKSGFGF